MNRDNCRVVLSEDITGNQRLAVSSGLDTNGVGTLLRVYSRCLSMVFRVVARKELPCCYENERYIPSSG